MGIISFATKQLKNHHFNYLDGDYINDDILIDKSSSLNATEQIKQMRERADEALGRISPAVSIDEMKNRWK